MAIALLSNNGAQSSAGGGGVSNGASLDSSGASLIVVAGASYQGTAEPTLSDSVGGGAGNTWTTSLTTYSNVGDQRVHIMYCIPTNKGASHVFSYGGTATYASIAVACFSGTHATVVYDGVEAGNKAGTGTSLAAGSVTPSIDNCLIIYCLSHTNTNTPSITVVDTGGVTDWISYSGGNAYGIAMAYGIQTTATARNPSWSWTGSTSNAAAAAVFRPAVGASGHGPITRGGQLTNGGPLRGRIVRDRIRGLAANHIYSPSLSESLKYRKAA